MILRLLPALLLSFVVCCFSYVQSTLPSPSFSQLLSFIVLLRVFLFRSQIPPLYLVATSGLLILRADSDGGKRKKGTKSRE